MNEATVYRLQKRDQLITAIKALPKCPQSIVVQALMDELTQAEIDENIFMQIEAKHLLNELDTGDWA